ncbi:MAG TPA: tRNA (guanosine(46)-N7)-methyltransferase TrmB [Hyphomicrobium sp.]|jgi:tRNA (guanine-N7-)-methyltransferase
MAADSKKEDEHELRSFGRRRGRKPSDRQAALLRDFLPHVAFDTAKPQSAGTTWLEIGFGGGEHLLWQARHNPNVSIVGCEPYEDGVIKLLSAVESEGLENVRVHMGDARDVLRGLAPGSVDRAFILFPDPWPKRKHRKRRLVNSALLDLLARALKPGAELRIGTDIGDYARTMLEAFRGEPRFTWQVESPSDWRLRPADWAETRYEAKAAAAGRHSYYFRFLRA